MLKNALTRHFNYELNQASPVRDDLVQVSKFDEDGNVFTAYEKFDYPKHQSSLGTVVEWSLDSLLKAGINPNFNVHTGMSTRLEAASQLQQFTDEAERIFSETSSEN